MLSLNFSLEERRKLTMALLRILRAGQITLPAELRKQFDLAEDDYVEVQAVKEAILLKPVAVVEREKAWKKVSDAMKSVEDNKPQPKQTTQAQEEEIAQ